MLLGIDIGTTGARALLIAAGGAVRGRGDVAYDFDVPRPGWAEQDPVLWWNAAGRAVTAALGNAGASSRDVAAVGLTGQMHSLTLLNRTGSVLRPAILWNDQRSTEECDEITRRVGRDALIAMTRNPALPGFTASKLLWVRRHEPDIYDRIASVLLPKDYLRYRLTGTRATDVSDASGTGWLDVTRREWSEPILAALEVPVTWLASCAESATVTARVSAEGETATGLAAGTPVVAGAGDQAAQAVGTGIVRPGVASVTIGTSGVVFASLDAPIADPLLRTHTFCHAIPNTWHVMGVMLSAGEALRWLRHAIGSDVSYQTLDADAERVAPGAEGLVFLPYLAGERTPYPDPLARGAFVGMSLAHGRGHLVRAVMEGVAFGLRDSLEIIRAMGVNISQIRASGGGAQSAVWRQILADVLGAEVVTMNVAEGAAYGAALLAGVGAGVFSDVPAACETALKPALRVTPRIGCRATYDSLYDVYRSLYPALRGPFERLASIATESPQPGA
jgi:xylulokinase